MVHVRWAEPTFVGLNVSRVAPEFVKTRSTPLYCTPPLPSYVCEQVNRPLRHFVLIYISSFKRRINWMYILVCLSVCFNIHCGSWLLFIHILPRDRLTSLTVPSLARISSLLHHILSFLIILHADPPLGQYCSTKEANVLCCVRSYVATRRCCRWLSLASASEDGGSVL